MDTWKEIWNKRKVGDAELTLEQLLKIDGFDTGAGHIDIQSWKEYVKFLAERLSLKKQDSIFEVGCGAGAFLWLFYESGHEVGGIDYSESLIEIAKKKMGNMEFYADEAINVEVLKRYDIVVSNGVFHYFPDYDYAYGVIDKMIRKCKRKIAILDVNDITLKEECLIFREEHGSKYKTPTHLYYDKSYFYNIGSAHNLKVEIFPQDIKNYGNNNFRFNVIMEKND